MLELKAFVQESVHALEDAQLQLLSQTLRVDVRSCDNRADIERILTGLLCLDKDTALGTFLTWLRTSAKHDNGLIAKKPGFANTFLPTISPPQSNQQPENGVKDHHLNEEITHRMDELLLLEQDFKATERQMHIGSPSYEKLKAFLVKLTKLRSKEEEVRRFFLKQSQILTAQHAEMKEETLHTRAQLDFFVDGFTNLRHRHDELLEKSTRMKAENEVAQEVFISMSAHESHFGEILHRTLLQQLKEKAALNSQLESAREQLEQAAKKRKELEDLVSRLKQQRGDALKDANSYKLQLRKCKQKLDKLATDNPECVCFRQQAIQLRGALTTVLSLFRESIARDTKSAKQSTSKEVVRAVQNALSFTIGGDNLTSSRSIRVTGAAEYESTGSVARVIEKQDVAAKDIDQVIRGVVLLGGGDGEAEESALLLSEKLRYAPVDLKKLVTRIRDEAASEQLRVAQVVQPDGQVTLTTVPVTPATPAPATVENYLVAVSAELRRSQAWHEARGLVLYNYELTVKEANQLISAGIPVDSIIELKVRPPPVAISPPATASVPATPQPKTSSSSRAGPTPSAVSRSGAKGTTPASPSRAPAKQASPDPKKATAAPPSSRATTAAAAQPKIDRRAKFVGMLHAFAQLEPVAFVEDRVTQILDELARLKRKQATPFIAWDEPTSQVNESLLMFSEDVHSAVWAEQENRKPKKPGDNSPPSTATSSKTGSSSPSKPGTSQPTSRAAASKSPAKAPAKGKAASPTRPGAKPTSPSKPAVKSSGSPGKSQSTKAPGAAASPKKPAPKASSPTAKTSKASSPTAKATAGSPGKRKAAG